MHRSHPTSLRRRAHQRSRGWTTTILIALLVGVANPVAADHYDSANAGHPVRLIAYALHPVGVLIDYVLMRPAHWLVSAEPLKTIFGHED